MKKYQHNQICTDNSSIEVGKEYDYTEDGAPCRVKVLADESNDEMLAFKLEVTQDPTGRYGGVGSKFEVSAATGNYAFSGMWRLWDPGEYLP